MNVVRDIKKFPLSTKETQYNSAVKSFEQRTPQFAGGAQRPTFLPAEDMSPCSQDIVYDCYLCDMTALLNRDEKNQSDKKELLRLREVEQEFTVAKAMSDNKIQALTLEIQSLKILVNGGPKVQVLPKV